MNISFSYRRLAALSVAAVFAVPVLAQEDGGRAGREREALRRAQAALRQSQEQQAALAKEKADLATQRDQFGETAKRAQTQLAAVRGETGRLQSTVAKLEAQLADMRIQSDTDKKTAQASIDDLKQRLADANRRAEESTRLVATTTALLEKSTQALAAAEQANGRMHALGVQMIEQIRSGDRNVVSEPVIGFGQVKLENTAEGLRDQLDATRISNRAK